MKIRLITFIFSAYQTLSVSKLPTCRYQPTCSRYAYEAVIKYGFLKGSIKAIRRIISCHPLSQKPIYDPT